MTEKFDGTFEWTWCEICEVGMVICPQCGNNCCNGHEECELCKKVYEFEYDHWNRGDYPKMEEEVKLYNEMKKENK